METHSEDFVTDEDVQALSVCIALSKRLNEITSPKDPDSLRSRVNRYMERRWISDKQKQREIDLNGVKFGLITTKTTSPQTRRYARITDSETLVAGNSEHFEEFIELHRQEFAEWLLEQGVPPVGYEVEEYEIPGGQFDGTMFTGCKPEDLPVLLGDKLPQYVAGLLEESYE